MVVIHAYLHVLPEKRSLFLEQVQSLIEGSKAEEGNITYHLYEDTEVKAKFIMVEEWKDEAAVAFHNETEHFKHFGSIASEYFAAPPEVLQFAVSKKY
ncbi:antibiotic biosynthesis monooxygenase [Alkalihalobacillus sp. MEB130]|uniref:putative quinol monooxygenase n=1 Tax=Alkalihalobacillus sp. MEB130 TaxID=2976704 RepID=UPI0028DF0BAB|nr:putative quinol monooxygenase [Alkalihalobacillus sp. MEB130]MDT8861074.1 antibiotic biosynthesis monooxygenase [Alkalihalobacillus sp. MEB130]